MKKWTCSTCWFSAFHIRNISTDSNVNVDEFVKKPNDTFSFSFLSLKILFKPIQWASPFEVQFVENSTDFLFFIDDLSVRLELESIVKREIIRWNSFVRQFRVIRGHCHNAFVRHWYSNVLFYWIEAEKLCKRSFEKFNQETLNKKSILSQLPLLIKSLEVSSYNEERLNHVQ